MNHHVLLRTVLTFSNLCNFKRKKRLTTDNFKLSWFCADDGWDPSCEFVRYKSCSRSLTVGEIKFNMINWEAFCMSVIIKLLNIFLVSSIVMSRLLGCLFAFLDPGEKKENTKTSNISKHKSRKLNPRPDKDSEILERLMLPSSSLLCYVSFYVSFSNVLGTQCMTF